MTNVQKGRQFRYFLRLGSGENTLTLDFADDSTAQITYTSHWMGQSAPDIHRIRCLHQPITSYQGFLRFQTIEKDGDGIIFDEGKFEYGEDVYGLHVDERPEHEIIFEYLILDQPAWHFSESRVLDDIFLTTGAEWNGTFTLFLFSTGLTTVKDKDVLAIVDLINHKKLIRVGDDRLPDNGEFTPPDEGEIAIP